MNTDEYHKLAEVEDRMWYFRALHRHLLREAGRLAPLSQPLRVLDAGCGTGGLLLSLQRAAPAWRLTGLDFSALACAYTRQRAGVEVVEGSITALPFADASFDVLFFADVLCQVDEPGLAFAEAARCLAPGGVLVLHVAAHRWLWSYHDDHCQTKHRFTRPELTNHARLAGFNVRCASYTGLLTLPFLVAKRKLLAGPDDTSDVRLLPAPLEATFRGLAAIEHGWLSGTRLALPMGSSVLLAATKPPHPTRLT